MSTVPEVDPDEAYANYESACRKWFGISVRAYERAYRLGVIDPESAKAGFVQGLKGLAGR